MANGNGLTGPTVDNIVNPTPLGQDLLPEPTLTGPTVDDIKLPEVKPMLSGASDVIEFTPEQARERDVARKYGVNIAPGINVQETAASLQGNLSKWKNGVLKGIGTAGTTFLEPFVDIFVGTPTAISTGKFSGFYNNEGSKVLDSFNEFLRGELPNYYSQAEKDYGFVKSLGTANFWADQGMQGLGFLAGAIASGMAVGASGVIGSGVKTGANQSIKAWRNISNAFRGEQVAKTSADILKARDLIGRVNYSAQAANMFGSGLISAFGEAGIEARETKRRSTETMTSLRDLGDDRYANMTDLEIDQLSDTAANVAFGLNTAIVGASNIYQFGKLFSRSWKSTSNKYMNELVQKNATPGTLKYTAKEMPKAWKNAYQVGNWFKRPAAEAFEEWSQAAINVAAEDYFEDVYEGNSVEDMTDLLEGGVGVIGSLFRGYVEAPQTKEGQQAIFLGALLGKLGEAGSAVREDGKTSRQEWLDTYDRSVGLSDKLNLLAGDTKLYKLLKAYNENAKSQEKMDKSLEAGDIFNYKNGEAKAMFSLIDSFIDAGKIEDLKSFVKDIGSLSEAEFKEVIGIDTDSAIKSPAEQARVVEERIARLEKEKPKVDLFLSTLETDKLNVEEKIALGVGIRYYGYMGDVTDSRENELASEVLDLSNGLISWETLKNIKIDSADMAKAIVDMTEQYRKSDKYSDLNASQIISKLTDLGKLKTYRQSIADLLSKITEEESIKKIKKVVGVPPKKESKSKQEGRKVKSEVVSNQEQDIIEAVENDTEQTANERGKRREQIGTKRKRKLIKRKQELESLLGETAEEEKAAIQEIIDEINKTIGDTAAKTSEKAEEDIKDSFAEAFPETSKAKQEAKEQDDEIQRLIEAEERNVDLDTTENIQIGSLLSYENASVNVRFGDQEGIIFKEKDGTVVFENEDGDQTVIGKFIDDQTLAEVGVEALDDQISSLGVQIIADGRTFEIGGQYFNNLFINPLSAIDTFIFRQAQPGFEAKRITLFDSEGNKVTFTNPFIVQELSRLITMMELIKQEAITEMQILDEGLMEFDFQGETYIIEDSVEEKYTTAYQRNQGEGDTVQAPVITVYNKNLNKLRSPKKIAQILKARDVFIDNYVKNKINAYINEYEEDTYGAQSDATVAARTEEEVKQDAQESSRERVSPKDIGDDTPTPDKTDKQAGAKPTGQELEGGLQVISMEEAEELLGVDFSEDLGIGSSEDLGIDSSNVEEEVLDSVLSPKDNAEAPIINSEESKDSVNDIIEDREIPANNDVRSSNYKTNKTGSNILGREEGQEVALSTIQSLAWKSANHPDNLQEGVQVDDFVKTLTSSVEAGKDLKGLELEFTIDLNDPQLTEMREMAPILAKLKKGTSLSQDEIAKVAMRVKMKIGNETVYTYVHRLDYVDRHIKVEDQEAARKILMADRNKIYQDFLAGRKTTSTIKKMTGGHLVTERGAKNKIADLKTDPDGKLPRLFIASNGVYVNENGDNAFSDEFYIAQVEQDGAIYTAITMANGQRFPLRVFVEDLSEEMARFVTALYGEALRLADGNINKNMPIEMFNKFKENVKDKPIAKEFLDLVESTMESRKVGPTYKQMLDMLIFHGAKTKSKVSPTIVSGKGKLRIGNLEISKEDFAAKKEDVVKWLMQNKRHHVSKNYMNSKTDGKYNRWLLKYNIVYSDASTVGDTNTSFVQPTLRYAPLKSEAPAAKKESTSSNQLTSQQEKEFSDFNLLFAKLYEGRPISGPVLIENSDIVFSLIELKNGKLFKNPGSQFEQELTQTEVNAYFNLIKTANPIFKEVESIINSIVKDQKNNKTYAFWQKITELVQNEFLSKTKKKLVGAELINAVNQKIQSLEGTKRAKDILVETVRERRESGQGATKYDRRFIFYKPIISLLSQSVNISAENLSEDKFPTTTKYIMQELATEINKGIQPQEAPENLNEPELVAVPVFDGGYTPESVDFVEREKESPKPNKPKTDLTKLSGGFQSGLTVSDLQNLGIEIPQANAFDIEADFGLPQKQNKSDITKSQEDQNCK
jgi:hypothetical protein